jgi:hypothetical protein
MQQAEAMMNDAAEINLHTPTALIAGKSSRRGNGACPKRAPRKNRDRCGNSLDKQTHQQDPAPPLRFSNMGEHSASVTVAPTSIPGCFAIVLIVRISPGRSDIPCFARYVQSAAVAGVSDRADLRAFRHHELRLL